jgi:hypothetical protein
MSTTTHSQSSFQDIKDTVNYLSLPAKCYGAFQLIYIAGLITDKDRRHHSHSSRLGHAIGEPIGGMVWTWVINTLYFSGWKITAWAAMVLTPAFALALNFFVMAEDIASKEEEVTRRGQPTKKHDSLAPIIPSIQTTCV